MLGLLDRLAAQLDLQGSGARRLGGGDNAIDGGLGQRVGALVEADRRKGDRAVFGGRVLARRVGTDYAGHVRQAGDARERRFDSRSRGCASDRARARVEDDLVGVPRLRGEATFQEVDGSLGPGPRQREAARGLLADRAREREHADSSRDPRDDHEATVSHCPASHSHHWCSTFHELQVCRDCSYTTAA